MAAAPVLYCGDQAPSLSESILAPGRRVASVSVRRPDSNGMLQAPTGPGLGAKIDFAMIKAKTEAVLE